jgi:5-methylcytosine-specific restriction endonuclease McrA
MAKYSMPQDGPTLFDGKVCTKCGTWKVLSLFSPRKDRPDGVNSHCKACHASYATPQQDRQKYERHKDKIKARTKRYYETHRADRLASAARYRDANQDRIRSWLRTYAKAHPEKLLPHAHLRLARKRAAKGSFTTAEWTGLVSFFGSVCLSCGVTTDLSVDHVIPLARGGTNSIDNLQPLCRQCNSSKGIKTTDYRDPARLTALLAMLEAEHGS